MQQTAPREYLITVLEDVEPQADPIRLSQSDFDALVRAGRDADPGEGSSGELVPFATVETSDGGPFVFGGAIVETEKVAAWLERGLSQALREALARAEG